ncbi:unnamed protein product [Meloidogyne enterolobii]|uniref:Uncharacterized protein n=1 Tax=Meloidogyne enterolobii TaxID=390850 RepID=A0ACB0YHK6_MELEN
MFSIKLLFFCQILFLIFTFCFSDYKNNQRILVESTEDNKNEDKSFKIKLLSMEMDVMREERGPYKIGILLEINEKNLNNKFFVNPSLYECDLSRDISTKIVKDNTGGDRNKLTLIGNDIYGRYRRGITICLYSVDNNNINTRKVINF